MDRRSQQAPEAPRTSLVLLSAGGRALSRKTEVLVDKELAADGVGGGAQSKGHDDGEGVQLRGDLLELSESLGDGVASLVLLGNGS